MYVTGTGATYEEAVADAKRKMDEQKIRDEIAQGLASIFIASIILYIKFIFNSLIRPIPGTILILLIMAVQLIALIVISAAGKLLTPGYAMIFKIIVTVFFLFFLMAFFKKTRNFIEIIEYYESILMLKVFNYSKNIGCFFYTALMLYTPIASGFLFYTIINNTLFSGNFDSSQSISHILLMGIITISCGLTALFIRVNSHPFCRHLTLTGLPRHHPSAPSR